VGDLVRPGITGYLAQPEDTTDFCSGIVKLLDDNPHRESMRESCRRIALGEYPLSLQAKRYVDLYKTMLRQV
jgi:glycosyltransferase involved in cell wall biosynthesis